MKVHALLCVNKAVSMPQFFLKAQFLMLSLAKAGKASMHKKIIMNLECGIAHVAHSLLSAQTKCNVIM